MNTTNNIPLTAIELTDKYGEKVTNAIEQLAAKIGAGVDYFWPLFVKQQAVDGWVSLIVVTGVFLVSLVYLILSRNRWHDTRANDISWYGVVGICAVFVLCISVAVFFVEGVSGVKQIMNPEYYAIKEIMQMIKP